MTSLYTRNSKWQRCKIQRYELCESNRTVNNILSVNPFRNTFCQQNFICHHASIFIQRTSEDDVTAKNASLIFRSGNAEICGNSAIYRLGYQTSTKSQLCYESVYDRDVTM